MILCDELLPNNVKLNLIYNFGMCSLFWRCIHFLYSKGNHFVYKFDFLYLKFINVYNIAKSWVNFFIYFKLNGEKYD
jgi:hypothetical protein